MTKQVSEEVLAEAFDRLRASIIRDVANDDEATVILAAITIAENAVYNLRSMAESLHTIANRS